jgi:hypothetical protein
MSSRWQRRKKREKGARGSRIEVVEDAPIVAICIPSDDHVHAAFCLSLAQMVMHSFVADEIAIKGITIQHVGASILPHSRYTLVKQSQRHNATHNTTAWVAPDVPVVTTPDSTGLEKAWRTGFAVVMVKAEVFAAMDAPYFGLEFVPEKDQFRGEDYVFFDRARAAGFELYVDHDLSKQVNHMGGFAYNPLLKHAAAEMQHTETLQGGRGVEKS